jgi:hypothetical protein
MEVDLDGVLRFHVSLKVDMSALATLQPAQIKALFEGMAQVLAVKDAVQDAAKSQDLT